MTTPKDTAPGEDWLARDLEDEADRVNARAAATSPDWEELGRIERNARDMAKAGKLTPKAIEELLERARDAVPEERADVLVDLERDLRALR